MLKHTIKGPWPVHLIQYPPIYVNGRPVRALTAPEVEAYSMAILPHVLAEMSQEEFDAAIRKVQQDQGITSVEGRAMKLLESYHA